MTKEQILEDIKTHLKGVDDEILAYGFALTLTTKNQNNEYVNNYITISKNFHNNLVCPPSYVNTVI